MSQLQVFRHEPYNEKCDVYSFAMICSQFGFTQSLFSGQPWVALLVRVARLGRTLLWAAQPGTESPPVGSPRGIVNSANKFVHFVNIIFA